MPDFDYDLPPDNTFGPIPEPEPDDGNPYMPSPLPGDTGGGPGGTEGPGGDAPGSGGAQFDWSQLEKLLGAGSGTLASLFKQLGLTGGSGAPGAGGFNITDLLGLLLSGGAAINGIGQRRDAAKDITGAVDKSNALIADTLKTANANSQPYITAGQGALDKWAGMPPSDMASRFVSAGDKSNLAAKNKSISLAALAGK